MDSHLAGVSGGRRLVLISWILPPVIRELLALLLLFLFAGGTAIYGYLRWLRNEKAMRLKDLPYTHSLLIISVILMIVAVIVMGLVLYAGWS